MSSKKTPVVTATYTLLQNVGLNGTVTVPYPVGSKASDFNSADPADASVYIDLNNGYQVADGEIAVSYGSTGVTITNKTVDIWKANSRLDITLSRGGVETISSAVVTVGSVSRGVGEWIGASQHLIPTMAIFGDSISAQSTIINPTDVNHSPRGYVTWFRYLTRQRFYFPVSNNFGVAGDQTPAMVARLPDVVAARPGLCFVHGGTNDVNVGVVTYEQSIANLSTIYDALANIGTTVFAIPILGRSGGLAFTATQRAQANRINAWIRAQAFTRRNFYVVDCGTVFDDPTSTTWADRTGYTLDGLHPSNLGAYAIGKRAAQIAATVFPDWYYPVTNQTDVYDATNNPNGNLVPNGMFNGGTTSATSWSFNVSALGGATATASKVILADGRPGQKITLGGTATGSNNGTHVQATLSAGTFQAGDQLEASVEMSMNNLVGVQSVTAELWTVENGTNYWVRDMQRIASMPFPTAAETGVLLTPRRTLTASPSTMFLFLYVWFISPASSLAVSGDVTFASAAVRKV